MPVLLLLILLLDMLLLPTLAARPENEHREDRADRRERQEPEAILGMGRDAEARAKREDQRHGDRPGGHAC